jgi:carbamoyl-phosphate synthase large subunit
LAIDVLVTGSGALLGQGIIKSLRASPHVGRIVGADLSPLAVGLWIVDCARLVPRFTAPDYVDELVRIAREERVHAILCGTDLEVPVFAHNRERIEAATGAKVVVSAPEAVAIADDKWLTVQFLRGHDFEAPRSALADGAEALARDVGFPLIVKPRVGAGSVGLVKATNEDELLRAMAKGGMVAQECLLPDDEEFTVGALVTEGRCRSVVTLRRTLRHGNTHTAICDDFPDVSAFVREVAEKLPGAHGPINFQLRRTDRGPVIFEINARFSGTTPLRAEVGFNEVEAMLRHEVHGEPIPEPQLKRTLIVRLMTEVLVPLEEYEELAKTSKVDPPHGRIVGLEDLRRGN